MKYSMKTQRIVKELGEDIALHRRAQGIPAALLAQRASISCGTLSRLENGDCGVSIGTYIAVLQGLGMEGRMQEALDPLESALVRARMQTDIPKRVR